MGVFAAKLESALLIAGRSGAGPDDTAAVALADAGGCLSLHGIALRPGASAGLGHLGEAIVVLLPGDLLVGHLPWNTAFLAVASTVG